MSGILRRVCPGAAATIDARLLRAKDGEAAAGEVRALIADATRAHRLGAVRYWTAVWNELMRA